jgi:putative ATPase
VISAFIKSIRASHPDAAVYYLARMIEAGEDPLFIARRLLISASEDIGNANPTALLVADSTFRAVEVLGLPEARIALSQCATYLAASPKSNRAYNAINAALSDVKNTGPLEIPMHLRNAPTRFMKDQGYGNGYAYAHDDLEGARQLPYLPTNLKGRRYYEPLPIGAERQLLETLKHLRPLQD